jgi:hypothetical protein
MTATDSNQIILIVAGNLIVAEDLRQSIEELALNHPIVTVYNHEDALAELNVNTRAKLAIIATSLRTFAASTLSTRLSSSGTHIILTEPWDCTLAHERGWTVLPFPFTSQDIQTLITKNGFMNDRSQTC